MVETLKEFKGMLWGQCIKVYTDHKNLTWDALGLTSDRVYQWRLILEEYGPEIVYIKGIHNTCNLTVRICFPWHSKQGCYDVPKLDDILKMLV